MSYNKHFSHINRNIREIFRSPSCMLDYFSVTFCDKDAWVLQTWLQFASVRLLA